MQAVKQPPMQAVTTSSGVAMTNGLRAVLLVLTVALLSIIGWNLHDTTVHEGDKAPAFSIKTDHGQELTPTSFGGKILVLNFWASWCEPCVTETPSLSAFTRQFKDKGVVVLGVSIDKNEAKYKRFIQRFHLAFDTYRDPESIISGEYSTFQIPETYVIKNGRIIRKFVADQNWLADDITKYITSIL